MTQSSASTRNDSQKKKDIIEYYNTFKGYYHIQRA